MPSGEPKLADSAMRGANVSIPQRRISSAGLSSNARERTCRSPTEAMATVMEQVILIAHRPRRHGRSMAVPPSGHRHPDWSAATSLARRPPKSPLDISTTTSPGAASAAIVAAIASAPPSRRRAARRVRRGRRRVGRARRARSAADRVGLLLEHAADDDPIGGARTRATYSRWKIAPAAGVRARLEDAPTAAGSDSARAARPACRRPPSDGARSRRSR